MSSELRIADATSALEEYKLVNENMRHYANMRFAQTTLLLTACAAILGALSAKVAGPAESRMLAILGLLIALVFTVWEFRASAYWHHLRLRALTLEEHLAFSQWRDRPSQGPVTTSFAGKVLHAVVIAIWLYIVVFLPEFLYAKP